MSQAQTIVDSIACGVAHWWEFAGDPLISGSVFMVAYGLTALLILRAAAREDGCERGYWRLCGWLFVFQVANTHLDLHGMIYTIGRCLSRAQGWYENRHEIQFYVLISMAVLAGLIMLVLMVNFFRNIFGNVLLTLGVLVALGLTLMKGVNYHHIEHYYAGQYGSFRGADLIELSGIALAFLAALVKLRQSHRDA